MYTLFSYFKTVSCFLLCIMLFFMLFSYLQNGKIKGLCFIVRSEVAECWINWAFKLHLRVTHLLDTSVYVEGGTCPQHIIRIEGISVTSWATKSSHMPLHKPVQGQHGFWEWNKSQLCLEPDSGSISCNNARTTYRISKYNLSSDLSRNFEQKDIKNVFLKCLVCFNLNAIQF